MLEEEYEPRRVLPPHLRPIEPVPTFEYVLRTAVATDIPDIREIYNHYVRNSTVTFDENPMTLAEWRKKFAKSTELTYPFIVAVSPTSGNMLGFAYVLPWSDKHSLRRSVEDSIYLGPAATGKGLGRVLLAELIDRSKAAGIREMVAVIADKGAEGSIHLHESLGFKIVGQRGKVGFKFGRWIGNVFLEKRLK